MKAMSHNRAGTNVVAKQVSGGTGRREDVPDTAMTIHGAYDQPIHPILFRFRGLESKKTTQTGQEMDMHLSTPILAGKNEGIDSGPIASGFRL